MSKVVVVGPGVRSKLRPRGRPFKKGEWQPFQYQPGQSGNPGGKPKIHQRMSAEYEAFLARTIPAQVALAIGVPPRSTWAEAIASAVIARAVRGDVSAAREVREATERRVPATMNLEGTIDYAAGRSAKEQLLKKLGG